MYKLITIPFSHYNDKARWGLERFSQPYQESGYMPVFHMAPVAWATRGVGSARQDGVSTRFSTPVLIADDGTRVCDSSAILRYLDDRHKGGAESLYASPDCQELEASFHDVLGAHSRRLAYYYLLDDNAVMTNLALENVSRAQARAFMVAFPLVRRWMKKAMRVDQKRASRSRDKVLEAFSLVSDMLQDGRPYLMGERFSTVDLSFACMAAPSLLVQRSEGYGGFLPSLKSVHIDAACLARELRATPAGMHAMRMFAQER